jgi:putative membrane protein
MNARSSRVVCLRALSLASIALAGASLVSSADARIKPRVAMFASVAHAAEFDPLAADNLRPTERAFLRQASEMARAEVRAAQLGVSQATSADVRAFAQQLVTDNRQISTSLEDLARKKGVVLLAPTDTTTENYAKLSELAAADFNKEFVRLMSDLQEETVKIYERALNDAKDTDIKDLAGSFLPIARDHLNKVRDLRKSFE